MTFKNSLDAAPVPTARNYNFASNEAPRSKLRGITELKHSELSKILLELRLSLHISFNRLPVRSLPHPCHIVPVCPGFRRKISRAVRLLNICTIRPGAIFGCALQSRWM